jgi:non-ribosomal peptide synthetase-like protein
MVDAIDVMTADRTQPAFIPAQRGDPEAGIEHALADVLAEVVQTERVSVDSHFFDDLGADSMVMARFCARVRKRPDLPTVSMKDIYRHTTIRSLVAALPATEVRVEPPAAAPAEAPAGPVQNPARASTVAYLLCGAAQFLIFLGYSYLISLVLTLGNDWARAGSAPLDIYLRAAMAGAGGFFAMCILPILAKWVLVGRWKPQRVRIWGLRYLRFWTVKTLIRSNPLNLFVGSPLYALYLRALGARIGRRVAIFSRSAPVCADLLTIGDGTVIRQDSIFSCYRAADGVIEIGPVTIGRGVFVGEATVLDINTSVGDGAQLGRSSSLQSGQAIPDGESWHGSPARRGDVDYDTLAPAPCGALRRIAYTASQLATLLLLTLPVAFGGVALLLTEVPQLAALLRAEPMALTGWVFYRDVLIASSAVFFGSVILGLLAVGTIPRLLHLALKPGKVYPLYGFHYGLHRTIVRLTNIKLFTRIFGDSSYIVGYLRYLGFRLPGVQQSGSNFGTEVRQEIPYLSSVGSGTMVADGLSIINTEFSGTSFQVSQVSIGPHNFLGNRIVYPAQGRTGDNCLLATKVMIPVDGPIREGVGLLGSPPFEIPRSVERDGRFDDLKSADALPARLAAKNRHNATTIALFLLVRWVYVFALLLSTGIALDLYDSWGALAIGLDIAFTPLFTAVYFVLVERVVTAVHRLRPLYCSIYDRDFWRRERYWKVPAELYLQAFNGTPFKNVIWRLLGARLGRRVFDDGCYLTERALCTIGDDCTLNAGSVVQCHSQEDGAFKSERTTIGAGCTLGVGAFVHYGVTMGDGAVLAADSFLMKGEELPPRSRWGGNPATEQRPRPSSEYTSAIRLVSPEPGGRSLTLWSVPAVWITLPVALSTLIWVPQVMPDARNAVLGYLGVVPDAPPTGPVALLFQWLLPVLAGLALLAVVIGAVSWASRTAPPDAEPVWSARPPRLRRAVRVAEDTRTAAATGSAPAPATPLAWSAGTVAAEPDRPALEPIISPSLSGNTVTAEPSPPASEPATSSSRPGSTRDLEPLPSAAVPAPRARRRERVPRTASRPATGFAATTATWSFVAVAAAAAGLGLLAVTGLARRVAGVGEALLAGGAALPPGDALAPLAWPDTIVARQIATIDVLMSGWAPAAVVDGARVALVIVSVLGCLLLWPVARRLLLSVPGATLAVALCGLPTVATGLIGSVDPGALAALWLTVAAALAGRNRAGTPTAVAATAMAALTAPLAAVGPLVLIGHGFLTGIFVVGGRRSVGRIAGLATVAVAASVAARGTGLWPTGAGSWAARWVGSGSGAPPATVLGFLAAGAVVVLLAWVHTRSLRPVGSAALAVLGCAAVPGPHVTTALLLALPALALLAAAVIDELTERARGWRPVLVFAALGAAAGTAWSLAVTGAAVAPNRTDLSTWVQAQLDPTTALRVDPLTAAQLIRDGVARERVVPIDAPATPDRTSVVVTRTDAPTGAQVLVTVPAGPGGGSTSVVAEASGPDQTESRLLESRLADNRALTLAPPAAAALRAGAVDLRLATALSGLTAAHRLTITDFAAVPGEPAGAPRRIALITEVDGAAVATPGATDLVQHWLTRQLPEYRPAASAVESGVFVVRYHALPPSEAPVR